MAAGGARDDLDTALGEAELLCQQFDQRRVRFAIRGRRRNPNLKLSVPPFADPRPRRTRRDPDRDDAASQSAIAMAGSPGFGGLAGRSKKTNGMEAKVTHIMIQKSSR